MARVIDRSDDMHCVHGEKVGGCGIDWMCTRCENGEGPDIVPDLYPGESYTEERSQRDAHVLATWLYAMDAGSPEAFAHIRHEPDGKPTPGILGAHLAALG